MGFVILILIAASMLVTNALVAYLDLKTRAKAHDAEKSEQTKKGRE